MKQYVIIPVSYRQFRDEDKKWFVTEIEAWTYRDEKVESEGFISNKTEIQKVNTIGGTDTLQYFLNNGWQIEQVQQAPIPACDSVPGAVLFQYILGKEQ